MATPTGREGARLHSVRRSSSLIRSSSSMNCKLGVSTTNPGIRNLSQRVSFTGFIYSAHRRSCRARGCGTRSTKSIEGSPSSRTRFISLLGQPFRTSSSTICCCKLENALSTYRAAVARSLNPGPTARRSPTRNNDVHSGANRDADQRRLS
jgi:hypothetical protein